jgi:hypothetical protein
VSEEQRIDGPTRISPVRIPGMGASGGDKPGKGAPESVPDGTCPGCSARVSGRFCANCGQRAGTRVLSLRAMLSDYLEDQFSLNTTLPRTLRALFFRPGHLTREFLRQRVSPYVQPFRLYLVTSLIFFLMVALRAGPGELEVSDRAELDSVRAVVQDSIAARTARGEVPTAGRVGVSFDPFQENWADNVTVNLGNEALNNLVRARLQALGRLPGDEALSRILRGFVENTPKVMFLLLPFYALILKLLYMRSKRFYVEHFIFALHGHAFAFSLFVVLMLAALVPGERFDNWMGMLIGVSLLWLMMYYWVALRRVYQQGWFKTTVKWLLLGQMYALAVGVGLAVAFLAAVFTV